MSQINPNEMTLKQLTKTREEIDKKYPPSERLLEVWFVDRPFDYLLIEAELKEFSTHEEDPQLKSLNQSMGLPWGIHIGVINFSIPHGYSRFFMEKRPFLHKPGIWFYFAAGNYREIKDV